jgi:hypothetical protein
MAKSAGGFIGAGAVECDFAPAPMAMMAMSMPVQTLTTVVIINYHLKIIR